MKTMMKPIAGVCVLALSACGGSGGGDDTIVSSGILELELPDTAARSELSPVLEQMINDIEDANENNGPATQPTGATTYSGVFGAGIEESDAIFSGTVDVEIDASNNVSYDFDVDTVDDPENPGSTASGTFGGTALNTSGGLYGGTLSGGVSLDQNDGSGSIHLSVDGNVEGAFDSDSNTFGIIDGSITGGPIDDLFDGVYFATETP